MTDLLNPYGLHASLLFLICRYSQHFKCVINHRHPLPMAVYALGNSSFILMLLYHFTFVHVETDVKCMRYF